MNETEIDEEFWDDDGDWDDGYPYDWDIDADDDDFWDEVEEDEGIEPECFGQYLLGAGSEECAFCPWADVCAEISKAQLKDQNKNKEEEE